MPRWLHALRTWGPVVALAWPLLQRLVPTWQLDPEYRYGWAVPVLCVALILRRGRALPAQTDTPDVCPRVWANLSLGLGMGMLAIGALVLESSPLWPTAAWFTAAGWLLASLGWLLRHASRQWVWQTLPPLGFLLTALRWPAFLHVPLMETLTELNARIAAELVSILGTPALVEGRVVVVPGGLIGVEDACSGLRSLQAVVMVGCFVGLLYRARWPRLVALLCAAIGCALLTNIARTSFLAWQVASHGPDALNRWHDPAGFLVLGCCVLVVLGLGQRYLREGVAMPTAATVEPAEPRSGGMGRWGSVVAFGLIVGMIEGGIAWWYAPSQSIAQRAVRWTLEPPSTDWKPETIPEMAQELLRYSTGEGYGRQDRASGRAMLAYLFRWDGDPGYADAAALHDPRICLPAAGAELEAELGKHIVRVRGIAVPFELLRFNARGQAEYVFFCFWDSAHAAAMEETNASNIDREGRLARVWAHRRQLDLAHLTFVVRGCRSDEEAITVLSTMVQGMLRPVA